jgi:outer membrane protein, heavy metal efflux system
MRRLRPLAALALFLALCFLPARAGAEVEPVREAAPSELSLAEVTRSVEASFPLLRAAERDQLIAEADVLSAEGGFDPSIRARASTTPFGGYRSERIDIGVEQPTALWGTRVFGGWRYGSGSFAPYDGKYETADLGEARVGVQVPLWRDGPIDRRRAALRRAEIGTTVARMSVAEQKLVMVRAASVRYWDWVAAGRRLAIAKDLLVMAVRRDAQLTARVERGDLPAYERSENLRVLHQREAQVASAERYLENTAIELSLYVRSETGAAVVPPPARLPGTLPPVPEASAHTSPDRAENLALAQRPEPKRLDALVEQSRVDAALADNQRKLGIDLFVMGSKDIGPGPPKIVPAELELGVLLDIPLLTRVMDGRKNAAEAQMAKYSDQARYARDRVTADVRDALSSITRARERASAVRREVDAARGLVGSERERFELGESTLLIVNLREQAFAEAELREVDAIADHHRGVAALRAALGQGQGQGRP